MKRAHSESPKMSPSAIYESHHENGAVANGTQSIVNEDSEVEIVTIVGAGPAGLMLA
jgi:NADPH-dependent 2,4-dienoyl-CoA reductase/sulfur reductase-like enzyme